MHNIHHPLQGNPRDQNTLNRRQMLIGLTTLAAGITMTACDNQATSAGSLSQAASKKYTIVYIASIQGVPFYNMIKKGALSEAEKMGVTLKSNAPAQWNPYLQSQLVDAYRAKKVDAIIITPCDSQILIAPLKKASNAGIKIITVDTFLGNGDYSTGPVTFPITSIGSDNVRGGNIAGETLIKAIGGKGEVYLQNNARGASTAIQRSHGFKTAIAATNGAVTLIGENFDNGNISKAITQTSTILQNHPNLVGIFGATAYSAEGAAAAVKNANKSGLIKIAHFDSSQQSIIDLRNGIVDLVIAQMPTMMGTISIDYAIQALNGDNTNIQKQIATDFIVINKNNVDSEEAQTAIYQ